MTDREKLVELLKLSPACICDLCGEEGRCDKVAGIIADNLIANGVRLEEKQATSDVASKWIPVAERVPGFDVERVLVMLCGDPVLGYPKMDTDRFVNEKWVRYGDNVSHWMHLPEPPREEDL